jgi:hypothetical protein
MDKPVGRYWWGVVMFLPGNIASHPRRPESSRKWNPSYTIYYFFVSEIMIFSLIVFYRQYI